MSNKIKIGFDLGNHSLKIAARQQGGTAFHTVPLPEHLMEDDAVAMPHAFSAFLKKTKKDLHLPAGPAGLILPGSQVICRLVTMPRMSEAQLLLNLPYEFSDFIHSDAHQYHCDYALCGSPRSGEAAEEDGAEEELTMMAAATKKDQLQEYVRMFAAAGFSLRLLLPQEMALIQLVKDYRRTHPDAPAEFCFIDLGYLSTRIFVVQEDRIQATRRIATGCRHLDEAVADAMNTDPFLADSYVRSHREDVLAYPACVDIYERIAVEALKLINFYHFTYRQSQLSGVYLIGGGAEIAPLRKALEQTLELPALDVETLLPGGESACIGAAGLLADSGEEG